MTTTSPWAHVVRAGAALAAGMGVGRFVHTPILPLTQARAGLRQGQDRAGLSAGAGANLATADYIGRPVGALAAHWPPRWSVHAPCCAAPCSC
ncbi:YbfB/YjiJ family MFS transporter [Streptomyces sp. NPDC001975]